jgi:hypothetical protein
MSFSRLPQTEFYLKLHAAEANIAEYTVRFRFNRSRLVVAFESSFEKEQYLFLSPGLFLKYFQRQKSLKKQNIMRVLMMRFLRKLLLSLRLKLEMLLKMIMTPLSYSFTNPINFKTIDDTEFAHKLRTRGLNKTIDVDNITYLNPKPFGAQKLKKRGRIKRKIRRKLVQKCNIID